MTQRLVPLITGADLAHGGLGFIAVVNGVWVDWFNPIVQILISVGGLVYLYYMIRAKRMEWLQRIADLKNTPK